jgi:hypothetical protein
MSDEQMPPWAAAMMDRLADRQDTMQSALTEAISDLRREMLTRFDKVDKALDGLALGEQVVGNMVETAERHAETARNDVANLTSAILAQQKLIQRLEARITALEGKAA